MARGQPVIRAIVTRRLGGSASTGQDIEDVCSDAMLALLSGYETGPHSVENIAAYASVVAYHACDNYFRRRFPQRHRLKNKLRYLLKPEHGFNLWDQAGIGQQKPTSTTVSQTVGKASACSGLQPARCAQTVRRLSRRGRLKPAAG